ncbi:hypothetical protein KDA_27860 [Dictyobacter alpinus]|uniref:Receptor ligand binding region domain-containing protein n=1 Tax=Dictyobacter alpinus TaxID=2014873 RepID=A0A402B7K7_9CHLR|nr:ABC transporter substrate-binding protein [Dictyobacter alpinus]GCE27302.1 hypothetical protein KDA_27860 [Dictyobacter alpinus]
MSNQNEAEHDPMEDLFMHVMCDRWAEKLTVTRVEHFSDDEREAFELHIQSCPRCLELAGQYEVVDKYFYRLLLSEYPAAAMKAPPLPVGRRSRRQAYHLWDTLQHSLGQRMVAFQHSFSLLLQGSGLVLLFIMLGAVFFQVEVDGTRVTPVTIMALLLAFMLILLGFLNNAQLRNASSQRSARQQGTLAWREFSLPMPAITGEVQQEKRYASRRRVRQLWRDKWIWGVMFCLLLLIGTISAGWLWPLNGPSHKLSDDASGAPVGISVDGSRVFDTNRQDGELKRQAASKIQDGDIDGARELWKQALTLDSNDAELLIYRENQAVKDALQPYFTLVVGTVFAQQHIGGARDILQGAYVAQKEYNAQASKTHGTLLRLMIASADVDGTSPTTIATQVVQAAQKDPTIIGVMGWSTSRSALSALQELTDAHLPMVSPTASSDFLTGRSPYFFRVAPPDTQQATLAANYAKDVLHAKRVVLISDPDDTYSNSLGQAFMQHYQDGQHKLVHEPFAYTKGDLSTVARQMNDILAQKPDLIYFAGYVNEASVVLKGLPPCSKVNCLTVLGGDALYVQGDYSLEAFKNYGRLRFTAFASEERSLALHPQFFANYARDFDPQGQYRARTYGYNATDADIILGYDSTLVLIRASQQLQAQGKQHLNGRELQRVLQTISVPGVSGEIHFASDGNPVGKDIVMLQGNEDGTTHIDHSLDH